jgi:putative transcriptional regulator
MMVHHPVPDELLLDYAVGSAAPGKALLVATHLSMCEASLERYGMLKAVGGALLNSLEGERVDGISAESVLEQAAAGDGNGNGRSIRHVPAAGQRSVPLSGGWLGDIELPQPLARLADEAANPRAWRTLGRGVHAATLSASTPRAKTQLLHARPGVRIFRHTHIGEELVLILKGAFWDGDERFGPGDVALKDGETIHAPVIDDAEDCLCLAVTEGPIRFVGPYGWLLNRFNRF